MSNHFSDMGFRFDGAEGLQAFFERKLDGAETVATPGGTYVLLRLDGAIEYWLQVDEGTGDVVGFEFHYGTDSRNRVVYEEDILLAENGLAGLVRVTQEGDGVPMNLFISALGWVPDRRKGEAFDAQIACFAESLSLYRTEAEYAAENAGNIQGGGMNWAQEHFIPSGMFSPTGAADFEQEASAMFGGHILDFEKRKNSDSGGMYYSFKVGCLGMVFDVLADAAYVKEEPRIGGLLHGAFWMSARLYRV